MAPISVLTFCCNVLAQRQAVDRDESWFWALRRKVAVFQLRMELHRPHNEGRRLLTLDEKRSILATHPLLARRQPQPPALPSSPGTV